MRLALGMIATSKINSYAGLEELLTSIQNIVRGQWSRARNQGGFLPDPNLTLSEILTSNAWHFDSRSQWRQGQTAFYSEQWTMILVEPGVRDHFIHIARCEGTSYNHLIISTGLDDSVIPLYLSLGSSLYALGKPWYLSVDSSLTTGLDRQQYDSGYLPFSWANWYSPALVNIMGRNNFLIEAPVHMTKPLSDGGIYLQVTSSLSEHRRRGWSSEIKRYFHGKRVQFANYGTAKS